MMKATLLIKNIRRLYLADRQQTVLENGWVACFHDSIVDLGSGSDYLEWLDWDLTRVVDASGETVIPVFSDPGFHSRLLEPGSLPELENDAAFLVSNGILNLGVPFMKECRSRCNFRILRSSQPAHSLVSFDANLHSLPEDWLMTTECIRPDVKTYSLQPVMSRLYLEKGIPPAVLLEKACFASAQAMGLSRCGMIARGMEASFLVLNLEDFSQYLTVFGRPLIHRMIFKGIPVYPRIVRC